MNQIKLHNSIDLLLASRPSDGKLAELKFLLKSNADAKNYFFSNANELWLDWLWKNDFLDDIKKKAGDPTQYNYRMPELNYLVRMVIKVPEKVAVIILAVPISMGTFNPEVIDQFLHICGSLPASELGKVVQKIRRENWVLLMKLFNNQEFEYQKILRILAEAKNEKSILTLAETILSVKTKEEIQQLGKQAGFESPFYFNDLAYTDIFESLLSISNEMVEKAFILTIKTLEQIVYLGSEAPKDSTFKREDSFYLFDLDFFAATPGRKHSSSRESVYELAAVIKALASRLIVNNKNNPKKILKIYENYIHPLPDSQLIWRMRLFILSLASNVYKEIIKDALFRLFDAEHYSDIIAGTEYEKLLDKCFGSLSEADRRDYAEKAIEYFNHPVEKDDKNNKWWRVRGSEIMSIIVSHLGEDTKKSVLDAGFKLDVKFDPRPRISSIVGGFVKDQSPVDQKELNTLPIEEIAGKLQNEWSPESLSEKYKNDDFLSRRNAEGLGNQIKMDIANRLQDYVDHANLFFDQAKLNSHYTYSFLQGIQEAIKNNRSTDPKVKWDGLIKLFDNIIELHQTEEASRNKGKFDPHNTWLASWNAVNSAMSDVVKELLLDNTGGDPTLDLSKYRDSILLILRYLLEYPDPIPEDEEPKTAKMTIQSPGASEARISDPFQIAINSVRGRAYEVFVLFVYQDGKKFDKNDKIKISPDCKILYEEILRKENTRAIMFMFGRHVPTFHYRDELWINSLLPIIFPTDKDKNKFYTAAWEGYLSNNLYEKIFFDPDFQKLYYRAIDQQVGIPSKQDSFVSLDEGLATHLALAFIYYNDFNFKHPLFQYFLTKSNTKQLSKFVSFIGRSLISGDNKEANEFIAKNPQTKDKLLEFWDWTLKNKDEREIFDEFGTWVNLEKKLFEPIWLAERVRRTLEKTKGVIHWELGLANSIVEFAETDPLETLKIARLYLYDGLMSTDRGSMFFHIDKEWLEAFQIIYNTNDQKIKSEVYDLINDLIREGGSIFWGLEEVVKAD